MSCVYDTVELSISDAGFVLPHRYFKRFSDGRIEMHAVVHGEQQAIDFVKE
jgi:hypothetical protein